ncbi:MAG: hypothetical protein E4G96_02040 [Chrysiogenales bacterium]|nr:MAG: hypothetical protein E4G96_02040 [Chrysiogenales bacterium]
MNRKGNRRPEIVAPAGNLEKLRFAALYGADAVYFGGGDFNLRVRSDNFSMDDIEKALLLCRSRGVQSVFLLNSHLHENDIPRARSLIDTVRRMKVDAIMISDPGMMMLLRDAGIESKIHLSTQMSTLNHLSVRFWQGAGVDRIVLARETTLEEIRMIRENCDAEIEVFVHGALCIAYSGRCLLSRHLTGRDANLGDCSQSCRWRYSIVEESRHGAHLDVIEHAAGTEILSSMDLCLIGRIAEYVDAGVDAFKIEGRMKSLYYTANTTRIYRYAVEGAAAGDLARRLPFCRRELDLVSHRPYAEELFGESGAVDAAGNAYVQKALFLGYRAGPGVNGGAIIRAFNPLYRGETIEAIFPIDGPVKDGRFTIADIRGPDGSPTETATPGGLWQIVFDRDMDEDAILRRLL